MDHVVIDYPASVQVKGARTVHAIQNGVTQCKRRPANFTLTSDKVTCKECAKNMLLEQPVVVSPKSIVRPVKQSKPKTARLPKPDAAERRKASGLLRGREEIGPAFGKSRTWLLTPLGKALVEKWEREEAQKNEEK